MSEVKLKLTTSEATFLIDFFLKVKPHVNIEDEEGKKMADAILEKIEGSGYLDEEE